MPELGGFPVAGLTAPALLGVAIILILRGRLIPRATYDEIVKDRDNWRAAHAVSEIARGEQNKQIDELLEVGETVKDVLRALEQRRREGPQ